MVDRTGEEWGGVEREGGGERGEAKVAQRMRVGQGYEGVEG